jgi:hypothetical protein
MMDVAERRLEKARFGGVTGSLPAPTSLGFRAQSDQIRSSGTSIEEAIEKIVSSTPITIIQALAKYAKWRPRSKH